MRLLVNGEWFDAISSEAQYERDFQDLVMSQADLLFPEYHALPFRIPVESEEGRRIPDLALIDHHYRHWWVVEVEMAHHSLYGHVLPQVEVFAHGRYGEEHGEHLIKQSKMLDPEAIRDMIKGAHPRVLVVVNQNTSTWVAPIHRLDGLISVVEIFRSGKNQHILRINGDRPREVVNELVSACRLDRSLPSLLQVDSPAALGIKHGERLSISFHGGLTDWERFDVADQVWLSPMRRNPLMKGRDYQLLRDVEGRLYFKTV